MNNKRIGCRDSIFLIVVVVFVFAFFKNEFINKPNKKIKENQEFINKWTQSNINFFKNFKCENLQYSPKTIKINNFYSFLSLKDSNCDINDFNPFTTMNLDEYKVEEIKNTNVLIWIKEFAGNQEGRYEDGSKAIRLNVEINFIEVKTNIIFKKIVIKCAGKPLPEIRKKGYTSPSKNYYFGTIPYEEISNTIKKEIINSQK